MTARFRLPAPQAPPAGSLAGRLRTFLFKRWSGRILLAAAVIYGLDTVGLPLPGLLTGPASFLVYAFAVWGAFRLFRFAVRRLLWRIRTKLLVSYMFIAVVPVVLLGLFFFIAGALFAALVAGHMLTSEIDRIAATLRVVAETVLVSLPPGDDQAAAVLKDRLAPGRAIHSQLRHALVRHGRVVAAAGDVPRELPSWWKGPSFAGLVGTGDTEVLRAVTARGDAFLVLEVPLDPELLHEFEERTGIHILTVGGRVEARGERKGVTIDLDEKGVRRFRKGSSQEVSGVAFFALPERTHWATGKTEAEPLTFHFQPWDFVRRLSPGVFNTADLLVKGLAIVGVVFLVMYAVAVLVGFFLARSITKSVHALSVGTEKLRQGDFTHRIPVYGRDQLGELAESFNVMCRGIQDLLLEQAEKQRLEEELRIARQIQMSLLPPQGAAGLPGLRIAALCLPAAEVGGDYYDLLPLSETRMGVLVADVSGKGTSAALYMAELKGLVLSLSRIYASPAKLLCEANRILAATMDPRSFITMTYAIVDIAARTMRYARAGHNPIIQLEAGTGVTRVLTPPGLGLGIDPGDRFDAILEEAEVPLRSGDVFLFFTDGLSEAMNVQAEIFGERRLRDVIEKATHGDEGVLKEEILAEIKGFVGEAAQHDDMTMVILKVA